MAIKFIKDLSQLITGGIGIVDDELVYKDSEGNVRGAGEFETVAEIPESLDPGQIVFVEETASLWRGLKEGETGEDAGTPFPIKGYKEMIIRFTQGGVNAPSVNLEINETNFDIDISDPTRSGAGDYFFKIGVDEFTFFSSPHSIAYRPSPTDNEARTIRVRFDYTASPSAENAVIRIAQFNTSGFVDVVPHLNIVYRQYPE